MNWRWVSLAAALAAIVIGYGAFVDNGEVPTANHEMPDQPGYYLKDAVILRTREDGSPGIELIARRIDQRLSRPARGEAITMESVRVNYFGAKDWQWELTAKNGLVPPNSRVVQLEGDVELRPLGGNSNMFCAPTSWRSTSRRILPTAPRSPVHMRYGQHSMTVKSLRADLTSEKLRLETVNGKFDPQTRR